MSLLKIYKISQDVNNDYDTYDSVIVVAKSEDQAKRMHPNGYETLIIEENEYQIYSSSWILNVSDVKVEYIGEADKKFDKPQIICASFNAG